jgi:hypothetical protein
MRKILVLLAMSALILTLTLATVGPVLADQPDVECEDFASSPGHASDAPGTAFSEDGTAHLHYAGEQDQNDNNPHSASQYDVACEKVSDH